MNETMTVNPVVVDETYVACRKAEFSTLPVYILLFEVDEDE